MPGARLRHCDRPNGTAVTTTDGEVERAREKGQRKGGDITGIAAKPRAGGTRPGCCPSGRGTDGAESREEHDKTGTGLLTAGAQSSGSADCRQGSASRQEFSTCQQGSSVVNKIRQLSSGSANCQWNQLAVTGSVPVKRSSSADNRVRQPSTAICQLSLGTMTSFRDLSAAGPRITNFHWVGKCPKVCP